MQESSNEKLYKKSSIGIVNTRIPKFSESLYQTGGDTESNNPVKTPLTNKKGPKEIRIKLIKKTENHG